MATQMNIIRKKCFLKFLEEYFRRISSFLAAESQNDLSRTFCFFFKTNFHFNFVLNLHFVLSKSFFFIVKRIFQRHLFWEKREIV